MSLQPRRKEDVLYCDAWNKDVAKAHSMAVANGTDKKMADLFEGFTQLDINPLAGFERFKYAASMSNHASFRAGILYAIPLRDANKVDSSFKGSVTVSFPDTKIISNGEVVNDDAVMSEISDAIEDDLTERGLLPEGKTLGGFAVFLSKPEDISHRDSRFHAQNASDGRTQRFMVTIERNGKTHIEERSVAVAEISGDSEESRSLSLSIAMDRLNGELVKEYDVRHLPGQAHQQTKIRITPLPDVEFTVTRPIRSVTYDYVARVYDVTGEPDGWGFFGTHLSEADKSIMDAYSDLIEERSK